jgi:hypothetical protein
VAPTVADAVAAAVDDTAAADATVVLIGSTMSGCSPRGLLFDLDFDCRCQRCRFCTQAEVVGNKVGDRPGEGTRGTSTGTQQEPPHDRVDDRFV